MRRRGSPNHCFGAIDVLVNNAGVGMKTISERYLVSPPRFWEASPEVCQRIFNVNSIGPFNMTRYIVPGMVQRRFGKIINISTREQTMVAQGFFPYGPSKAALEAASRIWAAELAGTGVDVNVFLPGGATATDMLPASPELRGSEEIFPTSIMRAGILWLSSDESNGVTGRRFVACNWNENLSPSQAAEGAATPAQGKPGIM